ncbi:MAG: hypothetical protein ACE5F1_04250 [Planctomycetota bacterium]
MADLMLPRETWSELAKLYRGHRRHQDALSLQEHKLLKSITDMKIAQGIFELHLPEQRRRYEPLPESSRLAARALIKARRPRVEGEHVMSFTVHDPSLGRDVVRIVRVAPGESIALQQISAELRTNEDAFVRDVARLLRRFTEERNR